MWCIRQPVSIVNRWKTAFINVNMLSLCSRMLIKPFSPSLMTYFHLDPTTPAPLLRLVWKLGRQICLSPSPLSRPHYRCLRHNRSSLRKTGDAKDLNEADMFFHSTVVSPFSSSQPLSLSLLPQTCSLFALECPAPRKCTANLCGMLMNSNVRSLSRRSVDAPSSLSNSHTADQLFGPCNGSLSHSFCQGTWGVAYASMTRKPSCLGKGRLCQHLLLCLFLQVWNLPSGPCASWCEFLMRAWPFPSQRSVPEALRLRLVFMAVDISQILTVFEPELKV